ncbi:MAG: AarF/ABC1/UbiB kinase family protein [Gloeomargaritaceae cyanobacterium C42_A2020_066]|nr:AarF/ABC1/UbiB kinase family protein [Gloeomargaritaceae cyanobacterium C42_A2020_066]
MGPQTLPSWRTYDPEAIRRYYRWRPLQVIWRTGYVLWSLTAFVISLVWDAWEGQTLARQPRRAAQLRELITELGPTFIKVGQALSTRPDLVRKDYLEELTLLQDQLPPFPTPQALQIIAEELGRPAELLYLELSPTPVAAASLGQVYRGRLQTGEDVAVKVQRPGLVPILTLDLYILRLLARWFGPWLPLNLGHDLTMIVDEFGRKLFEEIDYLNEARNAERFAANFEGDPYVKVPCIYWSLSSHRVLTLEWINGYKLTDASAVQAAGIDMHAFVQIGVRAGLQQLLEFGFFHADPHPGNLFLTTDGRLAYIDFGMMDQLDQTTKEILVDALVHLVNREYEALATDFVRLGFLPDGTDIRPIVPALELLWQDAMGSQLREFNFKAATDEFSDLMYRYPFRVPAHFALIIRSLVTQEGIALKLSSDFKIIDAAYPYVAKRLLTGETPQLRRRLLDVLIKDDQFQWSRLENLLQVAQAEGTFELGPLMGPALAYLFSDEGLFLRQHLVMALTADDRLHTEEMGALWRIVRTQMQPETLGRLALESLGSWSSQTPLREWVTPPAGRSVATPLAR